MAIILDGSSGISVLGSNVLTASIVGSTVQAYDANTAKYDDTTSNFTGILQKSGSNVLTTSSLDVSNVLFASNIGSTVQAYDANTAKYDDATANFSGTLQKSGSNVLTVSTIGSTVQAYDANTAKYDDTTSNFTGTLQQNGSNVITLNSALGIPASGNLINCTVDGTNPVGYRDVPPVGTKTSSYTLAVGDVGKYVQVGSGGSITIPNAIFAEGDVVSIFNNTSGNITITCTITTAYIAGTDSDKASVTLATRGVATILFISGTVCVITGNVS